MKENGYMTIYLALTLGVMISLCLALIEGCRYRGICLETECVMDIGMDSILAEYHRELFAQYNLFAVDCSYGTVHGTTKLTEEHLLEYMNHNFSLEDIFLDKFLYRDFFALEAEKAEMTKAAFVTDGDGEVFRRMAVDAIEDDVGIGLLQQIKEWVKTIKSRGLLERSVEEEKQTVDAQIREYDGRETADGKVIHIENPTEALEEKKKSGILSLVLPEEEISDRRIETEQFIEAREERDQINRGNIALQSQTEWEKEKERILFHEYLLKYMGRYSTEKKSSPLWYQVEYIIAGEESDRENLRYVINRIFAIREAANAAYLFGSEEKYAVAEALGEALAAVMMVPEIGELFTISLILGWAFAESVYDVRTMLAGDKIPLLKSDSTWHCGLQMILQGNLTDEGRSGDADAVTDLGYEDYLRIFLLLCDERTVTYRAMNIVEQDIRVTPGNQNFCLDACIAELQMNVKVKSRYGYSVEIERQKSYITSFEAATGMSE